MSRQPENELPKLRLSIKTKLLSTLLVMCIVLLLFSAYSTFNNMTIIGNFMLEKYTALKDYAVNSSIHALRRQAEADLLRTARDQASLSNSYLEKVEAETKIIATYADAIWKNPEPFRAPSRSFSMQEVPVDNLKSSVHYTIPLNTAPDEFQRRDILLSRYIEELFFAVRQDNSNLGSVFIVLESGVGRVLPWVPDAPADYDPRQRPWYKRAVSTGRLGWIAPYPDITTGVPTVTCSQPIYDQQQKLVGVVGLDLTLGILIEGVLTQKLDGDGCMFLLDADGVVIAHPKISLNSRQWDEKIERENFLHNNNASLTRIVAKMVQGDSGIDIFNEEGDKYLAYAPLPAPNWSLGVIMPVASIIKPALSIETQINAESKKTEQDIETQRLEVRTLMIIVFTGMLAAVTGLAIFLSRRITKPILALHEGVITIGNGDLDHYIDVKTGDELESLAYAFNGMTDDLKRYIQHIQETTAAKKKIETELEICSQIQASLLPKAFPELSGWEIEACFFPARHVAGDFYDLFLHEDGGRLFFVIADVCDKGVGPAMFAAIIRTLFRVFSLSDAAAVVDSDTCNMEMNVLIEKINDYISENQAETGFFATVFAGVLDLTSGLLKYVNCGHNPPYIVGDSGNIRESLRLTGPVLGAMAGMTYKFRQVVLAPGDMLFTYTDGLPEAHNINKELFSDKRVQEIIRQPAESVKTLLKGIVQNVNEHINGIEQSDDITILVIRRKS
jgi:sigma-B regulation protein RsbU (phosphoserine phosphatase)